MNRNRANNRDFRDQPRTFLVSELDRLTIPNTLMAYFDRFGTVEDVTLNEDDDGRTLGTATITFKFPPKDIMAVVGQHRIDGKRVKVEVTRNKTNEYRSSKDNMSKMLARSFSMGSMISPKNFVNEWTTSGNIRLLLNYTRRRFTLFFPHLDKEYKVEFRFKDLSENIYVEREKKVTVFTIQLRYPGVYFKKNNDLLTETSRSSRRGKHWERVTLIPLTGDADIDTRPAAPILPIPRSDTLNLGNWLVFRITFDPSPRMAPDFETALKEAAEYNLVPRELGMKRNFIKVTNAKDLPKPFGHVERCRLLKAKFDVLYMLESVISFHYFNERNLDQKFYNDLAVLDEKVACGILQLISNAKKRIWDPSAEFSNIWERMKMKVVDERNIPSHCALLRKFIITPTQIYIQTPTLETTNRVVRHFRDQSDGFVRIQFMDEGFNRVGADQATLVKEAIYNRIYDILKRGIQIGTKRYEFLAFSSSQLREQGCWFFAPTQELTASSIRQWMGVFSHEKVVAKHAVRMGQCFSSTRPVYTLKQEDVQYIEDVKHNGYTFSDGVGKISCSLAEEVAIQMDLKNVPSAFQFRLGGAKGVLIVDKDLDSKNVKVQLRPSQIKFDSRHLTLEVIRTSTYIPGFLNRQIITLLSALGVKDEVFMQLMDDMLRDVNKLFQKSEEAIRVLQGNADESGTATSMAKIIAAGFFERGDPYIKNLLNLYRVSVLKDLKKKAKIIVPNGAYLLGVMDETNTLEEGEVFVQICDTSTNGAGRQVITGEVVVFRNPCFHPGDVRVVKAVDNENLRHLMDVIVFPAKGHRDIPSMCSGGDLDGDDYTVYWEPKLLPPKKNFSPMDYTAAQAKTVDEVRIRDIIRFFVNYISNDNLGSIANSHLAQADMSNIGARDGKCILLAQLHSEAVDFPKSGKPALLSKELRPEIYPDFMQKKDKESYPSKKVLGRIFRAIDKSDYKNYQSTLTSETVYDTRMHVPDKELYIAEARELRHEYNQNLAALMNQFAVQTEAEICSGYIIKWLKKGKSKSRYEQHDYTMKAVKSFKILWRKKFEQEFLDEKKNIDLSKRHFIDAKAAAWYYVAYHPYERSRDMSVEGGFFSFPWSIYEYICDIAKRSKPRDLDIEALAPVPEDKIQDGRIKLLRQRNLDTFVLTVEDDTDEEEYSSEYEEYESDESSNAEVITDAGFSVPNRNFTDHSNHNNESNGNPQYNAAILNPIHQRPLEAHQSVVTADMTDVDLEEALLGSLKL